MHGADLCTDIDISKSCSELAKDLNAAKHGRVLILVGEMEIEYYGRAASHAPRAPRLLVMKTDGALLIHESQKREPLNWQPPGARSSFECVGDTLRLRSIRTSPKEEVIVDIYNVAFVKACHLATTKLVVIGTEEDIARSIASNPKLIDPRATLVGTEISTPYGKIDVLLKRPDGKLIVVEVKNERAGIAAVAQLKRYVEYYRSQGIDVEGVLVAPSISDEAKVALLKEGFRFVDAKSFTSKTVKSSLDRFFSR
ncbi:MAG: DUF91 domain-containing protein [Crenarchaeota archaeon]|nr:DUF91 domain-containing protein [Thermoproteota archaeon]